MSQTTTVWVLIAGQSLEVEVATKNAVCEECDGEGKVCRFRHECFTVSDFDGDEEEFNHFADDVMRGGYDVTCPECKGRRVVKVPNLAELTEEQRVGYRLQQERDEDFRALQASERRYGA